ncbi:pectinesterase family protein [Jeotgalibaca caeni]|uniref:pectinesterase family protein n=1 Tax=Jeotgalibaca caeni TaxID=3028623 RepID=UPI00237D48AD|nr:pectinesterase family protein [Jeotgalibaca caeni]MDE1548639.1 pectinesterase family protein [Jeotgalibaca caeni]
MILVGKETFCDFQTIQGAVDYAEKAFSHKTVLITVLSGTYEERVTINRSDLTLKGVGSVTITNQLGAREVDETGKELGTFRTATLYVGGSRNWIENITVVNTAGYGEVAGQALAVYADTDETNFKRCRFIAYQDTLFTGLLPPAQKDGTAFVTQASEPEKKKYRQYYEECFIAGSIDFIFGGATAWFHRCEIRSRKEGVRHGGYVTAASTPKDQAVGFVFTDCWLTAEPDVQEVYLGRPWRPYAKTWFIGGRYGEHIHPAGWHDWSKKENQTTADYRVQAEQHVIDTRFPEKVSWAKWKTSPIDPTAIFPDTDFYKKQ